MAGRIRKYLPQLFVFFLLFSVADGLSGFQRKLKGQENAQNDAFHASLLKQLADSRLITTTPNNTLISSNLSLDREVSNSLATFATNASDSLQIYTSDSLPTNPVPSSACAAALTAAIPCNSTIPLMA